MKPAQALSAVRALCGLGLHAEVLVPAVLEALHHVVPSYRNLFDWTDEQGRLVRYFIEGPVDAAIAQLYFDEFHNRRKTEAMPACADLRLMPAGVRTAAELDHPGFYRTGLYNEVWRPQGFHTRLEAVLRGTRGQLLGSLVVYRRASDPRFTAEDERRLAAVLPAISAGMQACGQAVADDHHVMSPQPAESLVLTLQGQVLHATPGAHGLLLMAEGGISRDSLSRPLDALAGRLLPMLLAPLRERLLLPVALRGPAPSVTHETRSGQFVARGELLQPMAAAGAAAVAAGAPGFTGRTGPTASTSVLGTTGPAPAMAQITLRRLEPHRVALERALRALQLCAGLTAGQVAVCRELYHGRAHADIGARLGISATTVVDHIRKAYRALDLRSALELRAVLDGRIGQASG
jgi:DNA-binding CsgD family transcriptional regulator